MAEVKWKNPPWLKDDRAWKYKLGILQLRPYIYAKRVSVIPMVDVDWECGMVTILFGWLMFGCAVDWEFDPNYDASEEEVPPRSESAADVRENPQTQEMVRSIIDARKAQAGI